MKEPKKSNPQKDSQNPSNKYSNKDLVILDPLRKDPSESPAQFATRALSQLEEGLKAHKEKYGNLRHPRPEERK